MELKSIETGTAQSRTRQVQFVCLLAVLLFTLVFFLLEDRFSGIAYLLAQRYMALPAMAFLGASFCWELPRRNRRHLYAGLAMIALFFVNQMLHQVLEADAKQVGPFLCAYGLCFPFAAAAEDDKRQKGLTWMAVLFVATGLLLMVYAGLLLLNALPAALRSYVRWDGSRFLAMGHPNICATLLMISMGLSAGFSLKSGKKWVRWLLAASLVPQFFTMALTNGRTTMILTCLLLGGIAFCALRGRGWKRFVLALLAALVIMAGCFGLSRGVYDWNQSRLLETSETGSPEALVSEQYQGTLSNDMKTLNGRTVIWGAALDGLSENSRLKLIGTEFVEMILTRHSPGTIYHTHNSWLEALYRMGLPGLAAALVITVLTVWSAAVILWRNNDLWKSCIALLTLCLMGCAMLEPYLFVVDVSYFYLDYLFLMCLGYLCLWRKDA